MAVATWYDKPLNQTIMLSVFPPEQRGSAMGMVGIAMGLAPAVGPTMSGIIVDNYSWRDLFGVIIPFIIIILIIALRKDVYERMRYFVLEKIKPNYSAIHDNMVLIHEL